MQKIDATRLTECGLQSEAREMRGHCAGHAADQIDPAIGQVDERKVGKHLAKDVDVKPCGMGGDGVARVKCGQDLGRGQACGMTGRIGGKGVQVRKTAPGEDLFDAGMGDIALGAQLLFDEADQLEIFLGPDGHVDVAAFRGRHDPAARRGMDRGGVDAGAKTHDQHRALRLRAVDDPAQVFRGDVAKRLALGLEVVQDRDGGRAGGMGQLGRVDHPGKIGHLGHAVLDRTRRSDADARDLGTGLVKIVAQDLGNVLAARLVVGIGEPADRIKLDRSALGQSHAGVGAADIGKDRKGHGPVRQS